MQPVAFVGICHSRGIKQTDLENSSGVDQSTISKLFHRRDDERYTPSAEILEALFDALGLGLGDILHEADDLKDRMGMGGCQPAQAGLGIC